MTDGRTVEVRAPDHGTRSTARFRSDIISWVGDSEPEYPGIGTMMRLIDGIMQRIQPKFMEYEIRDRTKVCLLSLLPAFPTLHYANGCSYR